MPAPHSRRRGSGKVVAIVLVLVLVAGLAYAAFRVFGRVAGTADVLDDKVPAGSVFYATAYLDPGASQKINLQGLAERFPALAGRDLGQTVDQGLEAFSAQTGLSFRRDIQPWLGTQLAVALEPPTGAEPGLLFLVASKDDGRARAGLSNAERSTAFGEGATWTSQTYQGVPIRVGEVATGSPNRAYAIVDHTVLVSNEVDVIHDAVDTIQGRTPDLADDAAYRDTVGDLPDSVLGLAYVNLHSAIATLGPGGGVGLAGPSTTNPLAQVQAFQGFGLSLSAQPAGFALDLALDVDPTKLTSAERAAFQSGATPQHVLSSVPEQAFGFLALSNFKDIAQAAVSQGQNNPAFAGIAKKLDLASVIGGLTGEAAVEVGPGVGAPAGGALLVGTDDPAGMERFLNRVATQIATSGSGAPSISQTKEYKGVTIHTSPEAAGQEPGGIHPAYAVSKGFGIIATSPDDVKAVIDAQEGSNIAASSVFQDARDQVPAGSQLLYVDAQSLLQRFGPQLSSSIGGTFSSIVEPNLRPIKALVLSSTQKADAIETRLFLLIR